MRFNRFTTGVVIASLVGVVVVASASQSTQRTPDELTRAVRELRGSTDRLVEVQLVGQRANAAQARLSGVSWELADLRSQLARARADIARYKLTVDDYEREFPAVATDAGYAQRMPAYGQARGQLEAQKSLEADLRAREAQLAETVRAEERRWQDALARLDALERELGPSKQ